MNRARFLAATFLAFGLLPGTSSTRADEPAALEVGFGAADITPSVGDKAHPVYMAGFGQNRKAVGVHDPLHARAVVFRQGDRKIALVSIDVVGFPYPNVLNIREKLKDFHYVLVSSTHNHEGPDTIGLWGPSPFSSGVGPGYLTLIEERICDAVHAADKTAAPAVARIGTARSPELLHDGREPYIKHDEIVAIELKRPADQKTSGIVVQWNCHPETLESRNTCLSADFVGYTVKELEEHFGCPVVYLTGTVGGLMTSLHVDVRDDSGKPLADGTFEKTERYGRLVGRLAERALAEARPVSLAPIAAHTREVYLPMDNKLYLLGRQLGVLQRSGFVWSGDPYRAEPAGRNDFAKPLAVKTEVAWLRLGDLDIAGIPGEIYPELVLDKVQDPPDPGADFPNAPIEPAIYKQLKGPYRMIIGLANDELGYIIPKRQWDEKPPFCYGRKRPQYGEVNSLGPNTAPLLCDAFRDLTKSKASR